MMSFVFNESESEIERYYEELTLGLPSALNSVLGVQHIHVLPSAGVPLTTLRLWENEAHFLLPKDLLDFYASTDGLHMSWGYEIGGKVVHVGLLKVNSLKDLKPIGHIHRRNYNPNKVNFLDLDLLSDPTCPKFNTDYRIIELEATRDGGYVCLVYSNQTAEHSVWLLDRSFQWHFLSSNFTKYFHMMLANQGLPEWHLSLTKLGMSPWAQQLLYTFSSYLECPRMDPMRSWWSPNQHVDLTPGGDAKLSLYRVRFQAFEEKRTESENEYTISVNTTDSPLYSTTIQPMDETSTSDSSTLTLSTTNESMTISTFVNNASTVPSDTLTDESQDGFHSDKAIKNCQPKGHNSECKPRKENWCDSFNWIANLAKEIENRAKTHKSIFHRSQTNKAQMY